jgi:hypothetical protein
MTVRLNDGWIEGKPFCNVEKINLTFVSKYRIEYSI